MKKLICLTLLLCLLLSACGKPAEPLPLSTTGANTVAGKLSFTLADFYRADSLTPPIPAGDYPVYEAPAGQTFLIAVMDVENLAGFSYMPEDLLGLTATVGETASAPTYLLLSADGALSEGGTVKARSTARVYCLFTAAPETAQVTLTATVGSQTYTALLTPGNNPNVSPTALGSTLTADGVSLELVSFTAAQKLMPSAPAPLHTFFDAGDGKTHLILKATATNFSAEPIPCNRIAGVTVGTTVCTAVLETADGSDLSDSDSLEPGQSRTVYFAAAFDESQAANKSTVTVSLPTAAYRFTATPADT